MLGSTSNVYFNFTLTLNNVMSKGVQKELHSLKGAIVSIPLGSFQSCKDVVYAALGTPAISLMCGSWGAELCTAKRLFTFMGRYGLYTIQIVFVNFF